MKTVHYIGPTVNLGRFGEVKKGDVLELTDKEASDVSGDPRFKDFDPKAKLKPESSGLPEGFDSMTPEDQAAAKAKAEEAEKIRLEELARANAGAIIAELDEMSADQLREKIAALRKEGKTVDVQKDASRKAMKAAIRQALNVTRNPADIDDGEDEGEGEQAPEGQPKPTGVAVPEGLDDMTVAELEQAIDLLSAEGVKAEPKSKRRADLIEAIKEACAKGPSGA